MVLVVDEPVLLRDHPRPEEFPGNVKLAELADNPFSALTEDLVPHRDAIRIWVNELFRRAPSSPSTPPPHLSDSDVFSSVRPPVLISHDSLLSHLEL